MISLGKMARPLVPSHSTHNPKSTRPQAADKAGPWLYTPFSADNLLLNTPLENSNVCIREPSPLLTVMITTRPPRVRNKKTNATARYFSL
jgi:hypothetical protein